MFQKVGESLRGGSPTQGFTGSPVELVGNPVQLTVPYAHAPAAPWMQLNGSGADPGDEMIEGTAISTGGVLARAAAEGIRTPTPIR